MAHQGHLNKVNYGGYDFKTILDDTLARLQSKFASDFNDFTVSSLGIVLLDAVAYGLDNLAFYLDRRASDAYLPTARTRSAVAKLARALGYTPNGAIAASVTMLVSLKKAYTFDVTIPKGFQFLGPSGLIFETSIDTVIPANTAAGTNFSIPCYQGESLSESFTADTASAPNQSFNLSKVSDGKFVVLGSVKVLVGGVEWSESPALTFEKTNQFEIAYAENPPKVKFGDNLAGNIPPSGSNIVVSYIASTGKAAVASTGTITAVVKDLVVNFVTIGMNITNPQACAGGDDPESMSSIKTNAPLTYKNRAVAITESDYKTIAESYADPLYGRIIRAQSYVSRTASTDPALQAALDAIYDINIPSNPSVVGDLIGAISTGVSTINTKNALVITAKGNIDTARGTILTTADSTKTNVNTIITNSSNTTTGANAIIANCDAVTAISSSPAGTLYTAINASGASGGEKTAMLALLATIQATEVNTRATAVNIAGYGTTVVTNATNAINNLALIGTTPPSGTSQVDVIATNVTAITTNTGLITTATSTLSSASSTSVTDVTTEINNISDHFTSSLSDEGMANLVTVSALAQDANGFYTAPSVGLIQSLQNHLDAVKEVTHSVSAVSGADMLLPVVLKVTVGIAPSYISTQNTIVANVSALIDSKLKDRDIGANLYVSDFDGIGQIQGVAYFNLTIDGWWNGSSKVTTYIVNGNIEVPDGYTITKDQALASADRGVTIIPVMATP